MELIHFALPTIGAGDSRIHRRPIAVGGVPVGIKADHAYLSLGAFGDRLGDSEEPQGEF